MKKFENGRFIEMTDKEIQDYLNFIPKDIPKTAEERLEELTAYVEAIKPYIEKIKELMPEEGEVE